MALHAPPAHEEVVALTEAPGGAPHEGDHPTLLGLDAEGWVYVGITIFLVLAFVYGKAHRVIASKLDERIADTRKELDRAYAIRQEAEALLAEAKARNAASAGDAEAIVKHAEEEAAALLAKAEADATELMGRRAKMAEDKIAAAERGAIAEVRARAADAAARSAGAIIADKHGVEADKPLVDQTIAGMARLN
ncbi:hypothetical protein [Sphingosinithalassobacter portus]|uniref:F0F1 ATP synthase subunit B family protein n=1 Tax=Stakelama portus TaxID=2676234 RepID=UPI000D6E671F|nr:hypothetical protein [Sphingosinithalassobacter portus]